jgi:hypothetical protein
MMGGGQKRIATDAEIEAACYAIHKAGKKLSYWNIHAFGIRSANNRIVAIARQVRTRLGLTVRGKVKREELSIDRLARRIAAAKRLKAWQIRHGKIGHDGMRHGSSPPSLMAMRSVVIHPDEPFRLQ